MEDERDNENSPNYNPRWRSQEHGERQWNSYQSSRRAETDSELRATIESLTQELQGLRRENAVLRDWCRDPAEAQKAIAAAFDAPPTESCGCVKWTNGIGQSGINMCERHFRESRHSHTPRAQHDE